MRLRVENESSMEKNEIENESLIKTEGAFLYDSSGAPSLFVFSMVGLKKTQGHL